MPSPSSSLPRTNPLKKSGPYPVPPSAVHPSNHSVRVSCCSHARCAFGWSKRLTFVPSSAVCCLPAGPYLAPRSHPPSLNLNVFNCPINCHSPLGHLPLSPGRHPTPFGPLLATLIPLPPPPSQTKPSPTPAMPATKGETILHHYPDIVSSWGAQALGSERAGVAEVERASGERGQVNAGRVGAHQALGRRD